MVAGKGEAIEIFIEDGLIFPPSAGEIEIWLNHEAVEFHYLEIAPYRLIQKI